METGEPIHVHPSKEPFESSLGITLESSVPWPHYLYIVGTIYIDETTHPLSHKVLDRAVLIDVTDINLDLLFDSMAAETDQAWSVGRCREILTNVQSILREYQLPFRL